MVAGGARFRALVEELERECARLGRPLRPSAAAELLRGRIGDTAATLHVSEAWAFRGYFDDGWAQDMAANIAAEASRREADRAGLPASMLTLGTVGQLVSALGQASFFAAENLAYADEPVCHRVPMICGDVQTFFGGAVRDHRTGGLIAVPGRFVRDIGWVLDVFADCLEDGSWIGCHCGVDDLDHADEALGAVQVRADRALLV